jgi:hypothetical protein
MVPMIEASISHRKNSQNIFGALVEKTHEGSKKIQFIQQPFRENA